jgi:glycosidase
MCTSSPGVAAATTLTALWKGIPMLYNGEEIGLNRRLEFFLKDPIVWPTSLNPKVSTTWNNASPWIKFYTKLFDLKAKNEALSSGNFGGDVVEVPNSADKVISFTRIKNGNTVLVVMNISKDASQTVTVTTGLTNEKLYRYSDGASTAISGNLSLTLKPLQYEIYATVASSIK